MNSISNYFDQNHGFCFQSSFHFVPKSSFCFACIIFSASSEYDWVVLWIYTDKKKKTSTSILCNF